MPITPTIINKTKEKVVMEREEKVVMKTALEVNGAHRKVAAVRMHKKEVMSWGEKAKGRGRGHINIIEINHK